MSADAAPARLRRSPGTAVERRSKRCRARTVEPFSSRLGSAGVAAGGSRCGYDHRVAPGPVNRGGGSVHRPPWLPTTCRALLEPARPVQVGPRGCSGVRVQPERSAGRTRSRAASETLDLEARCSAARCSAARCSAAWARPLPPVCSRDTQPPAYWRPPGGGCREGGFQGGDSSPCPTDGWQDASAGGRGPSALLPRRNYLGRSNTACASARECRFAR